MRDLKGIFPGIFTMGNMFCGFLAIISCVRGADPTEPAWLIIMAVFLDILDGRVARLSKSASRFGVELDSLADLLSFAVAPAVMLYSYGYVDFGRWGWIMGFIFIMAAAFRLARFNLQATIEKKKNFIGLPVPAAAVTIASYIIFADNLWAEVRFEKLAVTMVAGFALLMVSSIEYESNPNFSMRNAKGVFRLAFSIVSIAAIILRPRYSLFLVSMAYVLSGIIREGFLLIEQAQSAVGKEHLKGRRKKTTPKTKTPEFTEDTNNENKSLRFPEEGTGRPSGTDD
ncbi:MAG: CDP-diacylglycerol--serine O-phosphatidyltransferase [candidate division Zixibacteria bacterium CG_4_9_14_3_um_filter_46_8]|nr:MAG: CDP-diacylglycerol--serine O-phosphatidyltransferase [candidate division Zixibacteria bacterium CG_4_9_14_3_um_filter_46_8]